MAERGSAEEHLSVTRSNSCGDEFRVVAADNPARFPLGTLLIEVRRCEVSDHQGCIPPIRTLVAELEVVDGPRLGERTEVVLEQGYVDGRPWSGLEVWLEKAHGEQRVIGLRPSEAGRDIRPSR